MFTEYNRTYISRKNIKIFKKRNLSAKKMVAYMEDGIRYRRFSDILNEFCEPGELTDCLCASSGQSRETVRKRVYNWMKGTFIPKREDVFQISFALKLSLDDLNKLLLSISEMGIHYRNPVELIYVYGLLHEMTWNEAISLRDRIMANYEKRIKENDKSLFDGVLTKHIEIEFFEQVYSQEDLETFLVEQASDLGFLSKTVYRDFIKMLQLLQKGEEDARKISVEEIVDTYIETLPKNQSKYDYLIKVIRRNWPSKDKIYKMIEGSKKVNRKTMLLLFLITEEFTGEELSMKSKVSFPDFMEELSPNERLQVRIQAMNLYLDRYGMNRLDLGNPFDCMVLYALKASYEEAMSDRFREILKLVFEKR